MPDAGQSSTEERSPCPESELGAASCDPRVRRAQARKKKRLEFIDDLLRNLDIVIYTHLSFLFYLDSSLLLFVPRCLLHLTLLTPKPADFPPAMVNEQPPAIGALSFAYALGTAIHLYSSAPSAGEATRGYIHGSLLIDFVGVKGPVSKLKLISLDFLVLMLEIIMLGIQLERCRLRKDQGSSGENAVQDLDAEERGVMREEGSEMDEDIELRPLNRHPTTHPDAGDDILDGRIRDAPSTDHPLDIYHTGSVIVAEIGILDAIRSQLWKKRSGVSNMEARRLLADTLRTGGLGIRWRGAGNQA